MPCDLQTVLDQACDSGIAKLTDPIKLSRVTAQLICEAAEGGGGGAAVWGGITGTLSNQLDLQAALDAAAGTAVWGSITGTLSNQTDLQTALDAKLNLSGGTMTGLLTIAQATANTSAFVSTGYSLTGANAQSLLSLAGTWNTSGTPTAIDLNITDTASNAASLLMNLRTGGTSRFSVSRIGTCIAVNFISATSITAGGNIQSSSTFWNSTDSTSAGISFGSSGDINLQRESAGVLSQRSGATAQVHRWYRTFTDTSNYERGALQTAAGQVILAAETAGTGGDDIEVALTSAGASSVNVTRGLLRYGTAFTVATLPAAGVAGRMAYVTDALLPAFLATVAGGGAVVTPVFDNGANWVVI